METPCARQSRNCSFQRGWTALDQPCGRTRLKSGAPVIGREFELVRGSKRRRYSHGPQNIAALSVVSPAKRDLVTIPKSEAHAVRFNYFGDNLIQVENLAI
jgi:hypothetical protein